MTDDLADLAADVAADPLADAASPVAVGLTAAEHRAMEITVDLWHRLGLIAARGPACHADLGELAHHIHALQRAVLAQAAARAYPGRYRLLGGETPGVSPAGERPPPTVTTGAV